MPDTLTDQAGRPLRLFHLSRSRLAPGDVIIPAAQLTAEQWAARPEHWRTNDNLHLAHYDDQVVYIVDERALTSADWHPYFDMENLYEVQPLGPLSRDPEGAGVLHDWEARHGHPFETIDQYGYDGPGWRKDTCEQCREDDSVGYDGPEWYHPYNWTASAARVIQLVPEDDWPEHTGEDDAWKEDHVAWLAEIRAAAQPAAA